MYWSTLIIFFFVVILAFAVAIFLKDRRDRSRPVSKAMRKEIKAELDEELEQALSRKEKFESALKRAGDNIEETKRLPTFPNAKKDE